MRMDDEERDKLTTKNSQHQISYGFWHLGDNESTINRTV